jgi:hypothetical protein
MDVDAFLLEPFLEVSCLRIDVVLLVGLATLWLRFLQNYYLPRW